MTETNQLPWQILQHVQSQISMADAKAAGLLAGTGIVTGAILSNLESVCLRLEGHNFATILSLASAFAMLVSILCSMACFLPNFAGKKNERVSSLIFFKHISEIKPLDYQELLKKMRDDSDIAFMEISQQIAALSSVATTKFREIIIATWAAAISIGLGVVALAATL